ncbi:MAG: AAA family ATPase [Lachnospiraceae bacterium]|nr:AAA family ATPase [Lachnospiraceae bacterium]
MSRYPVIMLTLKSAKQNDFELAFACLKESIAEEFARHEEVVMENLENSEDVAKYKAIRGRMGTGNDYYTSLAFLSRCLYQAHGRKCVILIDEYDVPLESACFHGYYE